MYSPIYHYRFIDVFILSISFDNENIMIVVAVQSNHTDSSKIAWSALQKAKRNISRFVNLERSNSRFRIIIIIIFFQIKLC